MQPAIRENLAHAFFLLFNGEDRNGSRKILHGVRLPVALNHGNPNGIGGGVQDVCSMPRRLHPAVVKLVGIHGRADVLRDMAEARPRFARPRRQVVLAWQLMLKQILLGH